MSTLKFRLQLSYKHGLYLPSGRTQNSRVSGHRRKGKIRRTHVNSIGYYVLMDVSTPDILNVPFVKLYTVVTL